MYFITQYIRFNSTKQIFQFLGGIKDSEGLYYPWGYPNHQLMNMHY